MSSAEISAFIEQRVDRTEGEKIMKQHRILGSSLIVTSMVFVCFVAPPLAADDFYVTITSDTNDGLCPPPFACSLRDAILTANANPGYDAIHVPAGTYILTIGGTGEDGAMTGDLDITGVVSIYGSAQVKSLSFNQILPL